MKKRDGLDWMILFAQAWFCVTATCLVALIVAITIGAITD